MEQIILNISYYIGILSLVVITYGSVLAIFSFISNEFSRAKDKFSFKKLNTIKINFSYYLLLGLDFLIASDVVRTIMDNTLHDLTILGISVVIRTVLSYFLGKEINEDTEIRHEIDREKVD